MVMVSWQFDLQEMDSGIYIVQLLIHFYRNKFYKSALEQSMGFEQWNILLFLKFRFTCCSLLLRKETAVLLGMKIH